MRNGIYHVYACGETIDYSNSSDDLSFSTPFLVDSIRVIIREESSQQRDSIMDIIRLLLPASAFGVLCYTSIVAVRCGCTRTRISRQARVACLYLYLTLSSPCLCHSAAPSGHSSSSRLTAHDFTGGSTSCRQSQAQIRRCACT
jgi:hypothetical protein